LVFSPPLPTPLLPVSEIGARRTRLTARGYRAVGGWRTSGQPHWQGWWHIRSGGETVRMRSRPEGETVCEEPDPTVAGLRCPTPRPVRSRSAPPYAALHPGRSPSSRRG